MRIGAHPVPDLDRVGGDPRRGGPAVVGAVASRPFLVEKASEFLKGKRLTDEVIAEAAGMVANRAKPMDNTDMDLYWRKEVADDFAGYALRELRGDDLRETRLRIARQAL